MGAARCSDCEKNVRLEINDSEVNDYSFDEGAFAIEVEIHLSFTCIECGCDMGEYTGTSTQIVPKLEDYIENHENLDVTDAELEEPQITETKVITRNGRKTYIAKWVTQLKLSNKKFCVYGELACTQDQIELYSKNNL